MLVCESPQLLQWRPNLSSSGQASPDWTRLVCDSVELCNTMEWTDWHEPDLVQVIVCEECGHSGCATGGYVRVSHLGSHVLWSPPQRNTEDEWETHEYRPSHAIIEHGGVAIPVAEWERWRSRFRNVPAAKELPPTQRGELKAAWMIEVPSLDRLEALSDLTRLVSKSLVAADSYSIDDALRRLLG